MPRRLVVASAVGSILFSAPAIAQQVDVTSSLISGPDEAGKAPDLEKLETEFRSGNLAAARSTAAEMLAWAASARHARGAAPSPSMCPPYDPAKSITIVVWAGTDGTGPSALRRLTLPEPTSSPESVDLPGLRPTSPPCLHEVLFAPDARARLVSQYGFTREENPIHAQLPAVAEKLAGPLFGVLAAVGPLPTGRTIETDEKAPPVYATAYSIAVPFRRASVTVKSVAVIPTTLSRWSETVEALAQSITLEDVPPSAAVRQYVQDMKAATLATAEKCSASALSAPKCLDEFIDAFDHVYANHTKSQPPPADLAAIHVANGKFRKLVASVEPEKVERTLTIKNRPPTHFSLGLGSGVVLSGHLDKDRVKVNDDGILVADPLSRLMTMVVLNWSPCGYDAEAPNPQLSERLRPFIGGVITPDPGVSIGGSLLLARGVALTGGFGVLLTQGLRSGDEVGAPPSDTSKPLDFSHATIWFAGVTYNFK